MVINIKDKGQHKDTVYVGRGTEWGNPYRISPTQTREEVVQKYRRHLFNKLQDEGAKRRLLLLEGKVLVCHCKPLACHGDVMLRAIEYYKEN